MGNIAFVASTLPIPILRDNIENWDIEEIVLAGNNIEKSYKYLQNKKYFKISNTPSQKYLNFLFIFYKIFITNITGKKIYFFHECCWFNFDILIDYFNVKAEFYPQVTLKSFIKVETENIHSIYQRYLLQLLKSKNKFTQYKVIEDNNEGFYYILSKNKYNNNVTIHSIEESLIYRNKQSSTRNKNILILVGRETVEDSKITKIYELIILSLINLGYKVYIKNHPRCEARLTINVENAYKVYDPNIPFELIEEDFLCIIGCASTSLINEGQPSFSILNIIGMDEVNLNLRKSHLTEMSPKKKINFPINIEQLVSEINKLN